ncbi:MAG: efflux RND transporter periplasmic adaptor subunit [Bacteroidota bacterium]|nr:efflux RND transporter periplasmic adaptor subunit [Bacteroidota bacterium]
MKRVILLSCTTLALAACNNNQPAKQSAAANVQDTVPVFILHDTSVAKNIELPAELLPYEQAALFARVQGYVKEMKVDLGDKVRRGQTLALIEAPELQTKYAEFQLSMQAAKAKYMSSEDVYQRLYKASQAKTAGIVAPVDLERSRNQLIADSSSYEAARKLAQSYKEVAGYLELEAPFDGIVTGRNADRGALVGTNQMLLTVQNNRILRLRIGVPELYVASATAKKDISFRVDAYPEKLFTATLSRKSGSIDPSTRTEQWEFIYDNKNNELKAGAFAYVKLNLQRNNNSFVVPPVAIATTQERKFVILVKNGKAEWVDVRQGMSTDKGIEIFGNIHNGDTLVTRATDERKPGNIAYWKVIK